jgi:hypothetical protein
VRTAPWDITSAPPLAPSVWQIVVIDSSIRAGSTAHAYTADTILEKASTETMPVANSPQRPLRRASAQNNTQDHQFR